MSIHRNSRASFAKLDRGPRCRKILAIYKRAPSPLSDYQVAVALRMRDMNMVRPRITEMVKRGTLAEVGTIKSRPTGRSVRVCMVP